jgi:predicted kinase
MICYIIRGVSGSGKTTLAHSICPNVVSADDYFMVGGQYQFDASKLPQAHSDCFRRFKELVSSGQKVAVANTFTKEWEFEEYKQFAEWSGYTVFVIVVENRHGGRNVHSVPSETLKKQSDRLRGSIKLH